LRRPKVLPGDMKGHMVDYPWVAGSVFADRLPVTQNFGLHAQDFNLIPYNG
jgi:hypothetical protein